MADISVPVSTKLRPFTDDEGPSNKYLDEALEIDKREGLLLAAKARFVALSIIAVFLVFLIPDISVLYYEVLILGFMAIGFAQIRVGRVGKSRMELLLLFMDLALMTIVCVFPNPLSDEIWSASMQYKYANFPYFYILLASATLAYSWRTLFAFATWTTGLWTLGYFWASSQPPVAPEISQWLQGNYTNYAEILEFIDPNHISIEGRIQEVLIFAIVAGILALNSWRSRRLLIRQAAAARERANLARHFAPNIVDHLAGRDQPLGEVRSQPIVVMFVDIVGFTQMAEQSSPERVVSVLREFHSRMETAVFDHNGTLDKFLGDGLMVTFGTPDVSDKDAINALNCSVAMQQTMDEWNQVRKAMGQPEIKLSVGLHFGDVVLGDIGSERRLEFAVLGDVVNVASRLEALTRTVGAKIIASEAVIEAAGGAEVAQKAGFESCGLQEIRGREATVSVWAVPS
ncbi:adenylate/guanylate cyclase domain-containing protein [Sneathiella sp.]|jgi:adenylate cyclase|uniref:adenylate/guanylate cyclase domain-containing protein n=1 Tax=Sneathiella sp. TaxID=1964365 RepID=UPI0039E5D343